VEHRTERERPALLCLFLLVRGEVVDVRRRVEDLGDDLP
jgi:hypothetical protein